jgi:catechol 2,3-dioxygenase-like lactoylglutathione lyase family enzyme
MKQLTLILLAVLLLAPLATLPAADGSSTAVAFKSGEIWYDTGGHPINAHGGGMLFHEGAYYWYGENKEGRTWLPKANKKWDGYRVDVTGIRCYSSRDLLNWKDEGLVLKAVRDDPEPDLHPSKVCERPKVVYNPRTKKFVMWVHIASADYQSARAGVAVANKPTGPFNYLESVRPEGQDSRDQTLFQDDDGKAYRIYSSENNDTTYISLLTDDYLKHTGKFVRVFVNRRMEAQVVLKPADKYWFVGSGCTGWDPNAARSAVADSIWGPWKELGNPCRGPGARKTFGGQSTCVFPVSGRANTFIFMADRWNKTDLPDSRYLWLPLQFAETAFVVPWRDTWRLDDLNSQSPMSAGANGGNALRLEHVALNVADPIKMAQWYVANLGMKVMREGPPPINMRFVADGSGNMMLELYHNPPEAVPNYSAMNPLLLHVAFMVEDVDAMRQKLLAAGATPAAEVTVTPAGDKLAMLRDPWGLAIQLVHRADPVLPMTPPLPRK